MEASELTAEAIDAAIVESIRMLMPRLYGYARYRMSREDAEEAVGAALEQLWRARARWRPERGEFEVWLVKVGVNAIRDEARRKRRTRLETTLDDIELVSEDRSSRIDDLVTLRSATAELPKRDADLLAMKFGADLSNEEIGELLSMKPGAVAVAIHRAIAKVRAKLAK